jgi:hypothetical protein
MSLLSSFATVVAATFFVAPNGNDANDGSDKRPVKTIAKAVELSRAVMKDEPTTIIVHDGFYFIDKPIELTGTDPDVTIKAQNKGKAILSGALKVTNWKTDPEDSRMLVADFPFDAKQNFLYSLTVNDRLADFSAYPQFGGTKKLRYNATEDDTRKGNHRVFEYDPLDLPKGFTFENLDITSAFLFIPQEWASTRTYVLTNDWKNNTFILKSRTDMPIGRFNTGYQILNTRLGLKEPGTWMFEASSKRIIYWPREGETAANIKAYISSTQRIIYLNRSHKTTISGFVMEGCSSPFHAPIWGKLGLAAIISGHHPKNALVENCEIRNTAGSGIQFVKAEDSTVRDCYVHHVGSAGIDFIDGGNRATVLNNHVHHNGLFALASSGIHMQLSNSRCVGNHIHHTTGCGAVVWSSYSEFSSNHIHHTMTSIRDGGGLYGAMNFSKLVGNYVHDSGEWPGLYLDEGSQYSVFYDNVFENCWWPFHMHQSYGIVITNNVVINDGSCRFSFQGSVHSVFKDNIIKTATPIKRDIYVDFCDVWENKIQLKQADGTYKSAGVVKFTRTPQPARAPAKAVRVTAPLVIKKGAFTGGRWQGGGADVMRSADGYTLPGVPNSSCRIGFDDEFLYVGGTYEYNKFSPYDGCANFGSVWGVHDAVRFSFKGFDVKVFFAARNKKKVNCGEVVTSDGSVVFGTNDCYVVTGWWGRSSYGFRLPLKRLGLDAKTVVGAKIPFNMTFYNGDHKEYKYYNQPNKVGFFGRLFGSDGILSSYLVFEEPTINYNNLVTVKQRFEDGTCAFPGPIFPNGGVAQAGPITCERPGEGYLQPTQFDNHNAELLGYILTGAPKLQGFVMMPFSDKTDPSPEGRFSKRMDDSSQSVKPGNYSVRAENWAMGTGSTASKDCSYVRFEYQRGGRVCVLLDAQVADSAWWMKKNRPATKVVAANSSILDGVFEGMVEAEVNGKREKLFAKIQFMPKPVKVREMAANGRVGKRYILEFNLEPVIGNIVAKAATSDVSMDEAKARFAADGEVIDYRKVSGACMKAWDAYLGSEKTELDGKERKEFYTKRFHDRVKELLVK